MWKKSEPEPVQPTARPAKPAPRQTGRSSAIIGPSVVIKGDLTGNEDLIIQGRLEGEVVLKNNSVTVGDSGRVQADIYGKSIRVEGQVKGNLYGDQEVVIRASGLVQGNIVSPRVTLENGANFKGSIDMEPVADTPGEKSAEHSGSGARPGPASTGTESQPALSHSPSGR